MMADVEGSYDLFESAMVRIPMKEEAMQRVLQQAPDEPTQWNQPQELLPWGDLLKGEEKQKTGQGRVNPERAETDPGHEFIIGVGGTNVMVFLGRDT